MLGHATIDYFDKATWADTEWVYNYARISTMCEHGDINIEFDPLLPDRLLIGLSLETFFQSNDSGYLFEP